MRYTAVVPLVLAAVGGCNSGHVQALSPYAVGRSVFLSAALDTLSVGSCDSLSSCIVGLVINDSTGHAIEGVPVFALDPSGHRTFSDSNGRFALNQLAPGRYLLGVNAIGYQPARVDSVTLIAGGTRAFLVRMSPRVVNIVY